MANELTTTFEVAQHAFNMLRFSADAPLALPALDLTKPPIAVAEQAGIPHHASFRNLVTLIARPEDYRIPTRWNNKTSLVKTRGWDERHEDGCDVELKVEGVFAKSDELRIVLDGQVGCAELVYVSKNPLFAVSQFVAHDPVLGAIAFCVGTDMMAQIAKRNEGFRQNIWQQVIRSVKAKKMTDEIMDTFEERLDDLTGGERGLVAQTTRTNNGSGLIVHSSQQTDGYDPEMRLGFAYPFVVEYHPANTSSALFHQTARVRTLLIKEDVALDDGGNQQPYALPVGEFMAALAATHAQLFATPSDQ